MYLSQHCAGVVALRYYMEIGISSRMQRVYEPDPGLILQTLGFSTRFANGHYKYNYHNCFVLCCHNTFSLEDFLLLNFYTSAVFSASVGLATI